jgi:hypothetical protein
LAPYCLFAGIGLIHSAQGLITSTQAKAQPTQREERHGSSDKRAM